MKESNLPKNAVGSRNFLTIMLTVALLLTIFLVVVLGWEYWYFQKVDKNAQRKRLALARNIERIMFLDEVLTMSAKMAAATGDLWYEKRYNRFEPELTALIKKTAELFPKADVAQRIKETDEANHRLVEMERNAFLLVRKGQASTALTLLSSPEYVAQKKRYSKGMSIAFAALKAELKEDLQKEEMYRLFWFGTGVFGVIIVFSAWIFSIRVVRRWDNERKQGEEVLRRSEEKYRTLVETTNTGYLIVDLQGRVIDANAEYVKITGHHSLDEILGRSVIEWTAKHDLERNAEELKKCGQKGFVRNLEIDYVNKDGKITPIEINATVIETQEGRRILSLCRDITERKSMEEALRESEEFLKTIFSSMTDGMVVTDLNGKILRTNNYFCDLLGYKPEELVGKSGLTYYPKEDWRRIKESFERFKKEQSDITRWEINLLAKNGDLIPVSSRRTLLKDKDGKPFAVMAIFRDIREMKLLQSQLIQAEKLSATGELISGVAHELNNPLTGIVGYSEILLKDNSLSDKTRGRIKTIYEQANRCKNIILNLLKFARKYEAKKIPIDINEVIDSTLNLNLYEMESNGIKVIKDLKRDIPKTFADLNQLQSVILNLIQNANHALLTKTEGEKVLKIKTENCKDKIIIEVSDTGIGISDENIKKVFDPFFTTKEVGKGTGLGLSIVHGIIKEHSGDITVRSKKGQGTTFTVELPALLKSQEKF